MGKPKPLYDRHAVRQRLVETLAHASDLSPDLVSRTLVRPRDRTLGDHTLPGYALAKAWRLSPEECVLRLASRLALPDGIVRVDVAGPYLNFFEDRREVGRAIVEHVLARADRVGSRDAGGDRIVVEYSSPNIAKPFHVGHLRTNLIGHSLVRLFRHLGHDVISVNHLGDWGTQFGFVWAGCQLWGTPEEPSVDALVGLYTRATRLRKQQEEGSVPSEDEGKPDVNGMARSYFLELEAGDARAVAFWEWCLGISLDYFRTIYSRLGIHFDHYLGESFFRDRIAGVERMIRASGCLVESRGALGVDLGDGLGFVRIFAPDGRSLYLTRDIAAAEYRDSEFRADRILYVVGAAQALHFKQLVGVLEALGRPVARKIVHVGFGNVPGMKTRDGDVITLAGFLDEARTRALDAYRGAIARRPADLNEAEVAEAVSLGATYFYYLSQSNLKDFTFSWSEALSFHGDSGPYIQYALARLFGIESKAKEAGLVVDVTVDPTLFDDPMAYELAALLGEFDEALDRTAAEYEPSHLARYTLALATQFSGSYAHLRVLGEEESLGRARLTLFNATRHVLRTAMSIIGMPTLEKM